MNDHTPMGAMVNDPRPPARQRRHIGLLLFDGVEELDAVGPWEVLSHWTQEHPEDGWDVFCLSADGGPVIGAKTLALGAHHSIHDAPPLDVLIHPGGPGTKPMLRDPAHLDWVRKQRASVPLMTSVCTGSLVYAAAGLLIGRRATTHWASLNLLSEIDPTITTDVHSRFVDDGDLITSAGVSAGIDMALYLVARLTDDERAREVRREIQYEPLPLSDPCNAHGKDNAMTHQTEKTTPEKGAIMNNTPDAKNTMRAIVQDRYGSADVLRLAEIRWPEIADDEVLVHVRAAALDRGTWHLMTGQPYLMRIIGFGIRKPKNLVPGLDVAGTVEAVGSAVSRFSPGDEVFGISRGSFAEYAAVHQDKLARKPGNLTFEQAAAVPISAGTALQALTDAGNVQPGQRVLIIGASGGVGSYAVQLAKAFGAEVTGVCSTAKLDLLTSLGADHVIDYTHQDFADGTTTYDLILDIGGNSSLSRLRSALTSTGTLVIVGGEEGGKWTGGFGRSVRAPLLSPFVRQKLTMLASKERASDQERLTPLIEAGKVSPSIDSTYPLDRVPEALRHLETGGVRGKVVITV